VSKKGVGPGIVRESKSRIKNVPGADGRLSRIRKSKVFPSAIWIEKGIIPLRSRSVWNLMGLLRMQNLVRGESDRNKLIVMESKAKTTF
jgi:hypothetical protein